ncbi:MAG: hypothetical protein ACI4CY_06300 [Candidatus Gastranaerophilaceae bacterium]
MGFLPQQIVKLGMMCANEAVRFLRNLKQLQVRHRLTCIALEKLVYTLKIALSNTWYLNEREVV